MNSKKRSINPVTLSKKVRMLKRRLQNQQERMLSLEQNNVELSSELNDTKLSLAHMGDEYNKQLVNNYQLKFRLNNLQEKVNKLKLCFDERLLSGLKAVGQLSEVMLKLKTSISDINLSDFKTGDSVEQTTSKNEITFQGNNNEVKKTQAMVGPMISGYVISKPTVPLQRLRIHPSQLPEVSESTPVRDVDNEYPLTPIPEESPAPSNQRIRTRIGNRNQTQPLAGSGTIKLNDFIPEAHSEPVVRLSDVSRLLSNTSWVNMHFSSRSGGEQDESTTLVNESPIPSTSDNPVNIYSNIGTVTVRKKRRIGQSHSPRKETLGPNATVIKTFESNAGPNETFESNTDPRETYESNTCPREIVESNTSLGRQTFESSTAAENTSELNTSLGQNFESSTTAKKTSEANNSRGQTFEPNIDFDTTARKIFALNTNPGQISKSSFSFEVNVPQSEPSFIVDSAATSTQNNTPVRNLKPIASSSLNNIEDVTNVIATTIQSVIVDETTPLPAAINVPSSPIIVQNRDENSPQVPTSSGVKSRPRSQRVKKPSKIYLDPDVVVNNSFVKSQKKKVSPTSPISSKNSVISLAVSSSNTETEEVHECFSRRTSSRCKKPVVYKDEPLSEKEMRKVIRKMNPKLKRGKK